MLVLHLLLERCKPDLLWYRMGAPAQRRAIEYWAFKHDLTVYSYAPSNYYYVPSAGELSLIKEFDHWGQPFPVGVDVTQGRECGLLLNEPLLPHYPYPWDVTFTGWKDCDTHPIYGTATGIFPPNGFTDTHTTYYAPIRHLDDPTVNHHLPTDFIPFDDSIPLCTACFNSAADITEVYCPEEQAVISTIQWERKSSLAQFRSKFYIHQR